MKKNNKNKNKCPSFKSITDPLGSYTGNYLLGYMEEPDQDVDDL